MIINRQKELQGGARLSDQEMDNYISTNFPTAEDESKGVVNVMSQYYDNQLKAISNSNSNSNSAAGGGGSNSLVVPGQAFENTLTSLVTDPKSLARTKIRNNDRLNENTDFTNLSLADLKDLEKSAFSHLQETIKKRDRDGQVKTMDNQFVIQRAIRNSPREKGQFGGSNNKTAKNRRQRFNIRLV